MKKFYSGTFKILISAFIGGVFMIFSAFWYFSHDLPDFKKLSNYEPSVLSRVYDDKGKEIPKKIDKEKSTENKSVYLPWDKEESEGN